jgi:hypothetical protein
MAKADAARVCSAVSPADSADQRALDGGGRWRVHTVHVPVVCLWLLEHDACVVLCAL